MKLIRVMPVLSVVLLLSATLTACSVPTKPQASLYQRIGGKQMLATISSQTLDIVAKDPRTKRSFEGIKMPALKESLTNFLCVGTGGDCVYEGETMKNSHAEAEITTAEFELMVQALRDTLDANQVGTREKNELLKLLAPLKRDVVTK
ncbi:MAG TPA: group 1 truncated hemoglobin [Methylophilus sp.]